MLPEGWKKTLLSEISEVRTGVAKNERITGDLVELPYLRVANVQDGHIDLKEVKTIKIEKSKIERYLLQPGDILMTEGGDFDKLGRGDVWQGQISPCLHQNHIFVVRPNPDKLNSYFLAALSSSYYGRQYFLSCAKRSTNLASINSTQLKNFPIYLPPLFEQQAIMQILSTWDKAISTTDALLENSRQQKKALMQQLLTGKRRLPGFKGEWKNFRLLQRAAIAKGTQINKATLSSSGDYPVMNGGILPSGYLGSFNSPANSIIISEGGNSCGFVQYMKTCFWCGGHCYKLEIKYDYDRHIYHYLKFFEKKIMALRVGSGLPNIQKERLANFGIKVPPIDEQRAIAAVLDAADREITLLEQKAARLREEKKALMQQLLTGKRRVRV